MFVSRPTEAWGRRGGRRRVGTRVRAVPSREVTDGEAYGRFYGGRHPAPEFVGVKEEELLQVASEHGVEDVRVAVRDGWFAWSDDLV